MKYIIYFLMLFSGSVYGQFKAKDTYTVYVNYPGYTIKANVLNVTKKFEVKESLTYAWYASNKIIETTGGFDGKILDGLYTSYYLSNNLKEKGDFNEGLKDGEWIAWLEDGKMHEIVNWKKGIKTGVSKEFDNKGNLVSESVYKNGKLNGYQTIYENEKIISKKKYADGVEVIIPPKAEKSAKEAAEKVTTDKNTTGKEASGKEKKTFFEKIKSVFKKKDKKEPADKTTPKVKPASTDKPDKKASASLSKKKDKSEKAKSETK